MKIAFLIHLFEGGGAERVLQNIVNNLPENYNVTIITFFGDLYEYKIDSRVNRISMDIKHTRNNFKNILNSLKAKKKLKRIKKIENFDIVVSLMTASNVINMKTKTQTEKNILTVHGHRTSVDKGLKGIIFRYYTKKLYNKADKIIAVSEGIKNDLINNYSIDNKLINVIHNPFEFNNITGNVSNVFNTKQKNIISVGRLCKDKGQWHFINIANKILKQDKTYRFYVIGQGPLKKALEKKINKLGISKYVKLLGYKDNIYDYYRSANILLFTSLSEGFGMAIPEAIINDTKVVSADCPTGPREILFNSFNNNKITEVTEVDNGYLYKAFNNRLDIKKSLKSSEKIEENVATFILNNYDKIIEKDFLLNEMLKKYSIEKIIKKYVKIIEEI